MNEKQKIMVAKEILTVAKELVSRTEDVALKHQVKIAIKTLQMNDSYARIMGGMTKEEARDVLKNSGWSAQRIRRLEDAN